MLKLKDVYIDKLNKYEEDQNEKMVIKYKRNLWAMNDIQEQNFEF